ncbi:MAG: ABC transporter permease, partial [Halobacteriovoraceae bacterium]|nr:ABC transporter permease [Halobacteriovoraceae bacterium]
DFILIREMTWASMKSRYRNTFAGFLWVIFNPLLMYLVQSIVFMKVLKINVEHYLLFLLSGLTPWLFFVTAVSMSTPILQEKRELLASFKINPANIVLSSVLDNLVNFITVFFILFFVLFFSYSEVLNITGLLLLPLPTLILLISISTICFLLAFTQIFLQDTRFIVQFFISILFFLTPIFYPVSFVPVEYRWLVEINPLYILIRPFRLCLYNFSWGEFGDAMSVAVGLTAILFFTAYMQWRLKRNEFYLVM